MSYILGLLFTYSRYKHDAVVRIYADDHLVDELCLSDNINLKAFNYKDMPILEGKWESIRDNYGEFSPVLFLPEKLFLFEIVAFQIQPTVPSYSSTLEYTSPFSSIFTGIFLIVRVQFMGYCFPGPALRLVVDFMLTKLSDIDMLMIK